ncbi:hypothetical protein BAUCODRAFT_68811 [Baudoinia panamericana UAMH 10762]|uniref:Pet127-domain-containing protein n=1 Tax=Baudoinia panamericana (strain UAMH 10762) TaxID=717646 RepID=M2NCS8_BAUPA|nr:uncharacterized protein BAUCODRAFT_68811 [Baudoinia panamericana UAMH 10762]EMC96984.1 hypothetical protein BAUCODRAFT_68811 [Baudoinia panamericana UAMH 10762]
MPSKPGNTLPAPPADKAFSEAVEGGKLTPGEADDKSRAAFLEATGSAAESVDTSYNEEPLVSASAPYQATIESSDIKSISSSELQVTPLHIPQPPVPPLQYGLERALFNPGVYQLQDPHSRVYNFDPYLEKVMPINEFDFNALKAYKSSSQDDILSTLAKEHGKTYVGSTSSMTGTLAHFHYLLSNWRELNLNMLSKGFAETSATFTQINRAPNAIFLRWQNGTYAIDADKEMDGANVLMMLGKSMEKLLTVPREEYERYRRGNTSNPITNAEKEEPEAYEYTTQGDFLMRSQLDAHDPRLPGTGMFDLKTRAVLPIRMDAEEYEQMLGYEIFSLQGKWESYEREYYDMMRSTMLKYMLQARMGRMDGIFVAYHNIERIFGFQYLPIAELDRAIHGQIDRSLGDQEFRTSLNLFNEVLNMATEKLPETSLRLHFEAAPTPANMMWVFAEPMEEAEVENIQGATKVRRAEFERKMMGIEPETAATEVKDDVEPDVGFEAESDTSATSIAAPPVEPTAEQLTEEGIKPLFAATVIIQNFVNGLPCENNRPVNFKPSDKWEVQYILKEAPLTEAEKWARYEDCKARRRKILIGAAAEEGDSGDGEEGGIVRKYQSTSKKDRWYFAHLKEMVARGREFRRRMDKLEERREKVVVGMPVPEKVVDVSADTGNAVTIKELEGVESYMDWLYQHQGRK